MRLRRFSVSRYKNLERPIVLDDLGPIEVIHGPNNVGKSNLVQAIALFFRCLALLGARPSGQQQVLGLGAVRDLVPEARLLFHLERPLPIVLGGTCDITGDELRAAGIEAPTELQRFDVEVQLEWSAPDPIARITRLDLLDSTIESIPFAAKLPAVMARAPTRVGPTDRFALVGVRRGIEETIISRENDTVSLAQEMYDCRDTPDRVRRDRWRAFVRAMQDFQDLTGPGVFEAIYPRDERIARLVFDTDEMRIPFGLLGTGVQQVASLLGHALVRSASILAIEEPELNLRWDLQDRVRVALRRLVTEPHGKGGVDQIFLTSHSPAFETTDRFWWMDPGPHGPAVSRRPASDLPAVLGVAPTHLGLPSSAPQAYVTSEGIVRLPPHAIERLRLPQGGGVFFVDAEPRGVRLLSNDDYLDELGLADDQADGDAQR